LAHQGREEPETGAKPSVAPPINLESRESQSYQVSWEYDAGNMSKLELSALVEKLLVLLRYTAPDGSEREYTVDQAQPVYPTVTPTGK
jgi:hypothetical protein